VSERIRDQDVQGLKYFDRLAPLLERLHEAAVSATRQAIARCTTINTAY